MKSFEEPVFFFLMQNYLFFFTLLIPSLLCAQIPGDALLWLEADTGVVQSAGKVSQWQDLSPYKNSVKQNTVTSQPEILPNALNGHSAIVFHGNGEFMVGPSIFPQKKDYTIISVIRIDDPANINNIISGNDHALFFGSDLYPRVAHGDFNFQLISTLKIDTNFSIVSVRYSQNNGQAKVYVNGQSGDSLYVSSNETDSVIYIGSFREQYTLHGAISELVLFDRQLSESELAGFESSLRAKYAIPLGLPAPKPDSTFTELPANRQLYPRGKDDSAIVPIKGNIRNQGFDSVYCIVIKNNFPIVRYIEKLNYVEGIASFSFHPSIHSEMSEYTFKIGILSSVKDSLLAQCDSIVCGDTFLIAGQSNAVYGYADASLNKTNEFCRTFGMVFSRNIRDTQWAYSSAYYFGDSPSNVCGWGLRLQQRILESQKIPTCIINGGYSGTIIEYHEPDSVYHQNLLSIYGRMYYRTTKSKLAQSAKALFWVQGELYSKVETYYGLFKKLYSNWLQDYPGLSKIYVGQLRPSSCANIPIVVLRDLQRTVEDSLSLIESFSLTGIPHQDGCHFHDSGWVAFGDVVYNLIAADFYHSADTIGIHSPHIYKAFYTTKNREEIKLVFKPKGESVLSSSDTIIEGIAASLKDYFYFDDTSIKVTELSFFHDTITLKLNQPNLSATISYLPERYYNNTSIMYQGPWLTSSRGVGALIFYHFPIDDWKSDTQIPIDPGILTLEINPNPVHKQTILKYNLPKKAFVEISIYNVLGEKLMTLVNESKDQGLHEYAFDSDPLSAGEYFCHLQVGDKMVSKKIILTK
jgi:hypothetical protein